MTANGASKAFYADRETADVVADFIGGSAIAHAMVDHQADGLQTCSLVEARQTWRSRQLNVGSCFLTSVSRVVSHTTACFHVGEIVLHLLSDVIHHRFMKLALVPLGPQDLVRVSFHDLFGDLILSPHRVDGDDRSREIHKFQNLGNRGDLVRLLRRGDLGQG